MYKLPMSKHKGLQNYNHERIKFVVTIDNILSEKVYFITILALHVIILFLGGNFGFLMLITKE